MSYCRWSSDDYQCDVYCYESAEGFVTHVASNRRILVAPPPVPMPTTPALADWRAWWARDAAVQRLFDAATPTPIGLGHDGVSFTDATAADCACRLEALRAEGYNVPQYAIDALRAEHTEDQQ